MYKLFPKFYKKVPQNKAVKFLTEHFRYDTQASWNASTTYANNLKITKVIPNCLLTEAFYIHENNIANYSNLLFNFRMLNPGYCAAWNGRSFGYLILSEWDKQRECPLNKSIDMSKDFEDWEPFQIQDRLKLVTNFDILCDNIVKKMLYLSLKIDIEEEEFLKDLRGVPECKA